MAPSARVRDELRRRGVDRAIGVVPTGVDRARIRPGGRAETGGRGLVLGEAAAFGLPAVAGSPRGCDEVIRDGETGLLTKSEVPALAEAAIGLRLGGERRRGMAVRARQIAEAEFDVALQID